MRQFLRSFQHWRHAIFVTPSVAAVVIGASTFGVFDMLEWALRDSFFRVRSPEPIDHRIVTICVDNAISDADLAKLIAQLDSYNPSAIGLALYRQPSEEYGSDELSELLATHPKLIGIEKVLRYRIAAPPELVGSDRLAVSNLVLDQDQTARRALLSLIDPQDDTLKPSLGAQLARLHLEQQNLKLETLDAKTQTFRWGKVIFSPMTQGQGGYSERELGGYQILMNWRGTADAFAAVTLSQIFTQQVAPSLIEGRMILIGSADTVIDSVVKTPFGSDRTMANFIVQANIASQLTSAVLEGRMLLTSWQSLGQWVWILAWAGLGTSSTWWLCQRIEESVALCEVTGARNWFVKGSQKISLPLLASLLLAVSVPVLGYGAFLAGVIVPMAAPIVAIAISVSATTNNHKRYRLNLVNQQLAFANQELFDYSRTLQQRVSDRTKALEKAKHAADAANQAKSDFLANMSHELRTPLNGILGYAQLLSCSEVIPDKQQEGLSIIKQCGNHLLTLINDILDIAKIEARKLELYPGEIHLPHFLESVCEICRLKAEEKGLSFYLEVSESLPTGIYADEKRLRQVLLNLLGNAIKFTQQGHVRLRVEALMPMSQDASEEILREGLHSEVLPIDRPSALLHFQVEDSGIGITPQQINRIFLPFEQVGEIVRKKEGTGLGLSIRQQIVHLMDGEIQLKSMPDQGSLFWFDIELPTVEHAFEANSGSRDQTEVGVRWRSLHAPQPLGTLVEKTGAAVEIKDYANGKGPTILIVDARASDRALLKDMLLPTGCYVIEDDGTSGVEILQREALDLTIVDMSRQGSSSYSFTEAVRQQPAFQKLPILATSARVFEVDHQHYLAAGANDFVPKPIQREQLLNAIARQLHITWHSHQPAAPSPTAASEHLLRHPADPERLPSEVLSRLYHLAMMGNLEAIQSDLETLKVDTPELRTFAETLQPLIDSFQVKKIKAYLTAQMSEQMLEDTHVDRQFTPASSPTANI